MNPLAKAARKYSLLPQRISLWSFTVLPPQLTRQSPSLLVIKSLECLENR